MKKIKIISLIILIIIGINTTVSASAATIAASHATITSAAINNRRSKSYTFDKAVEYIFENTGNEDLKQYILDNKDYLYLSSEDRAKQIIEQYNTNGLESAKQYIKDNYYDENKPEIEKKILTIFVIVLLIILVCGVLAIILC